MIKSMYSEIYKGHAIYGMTDAGAVWFEFCIDHGLYSETKYFDTLEAAKQFIDKEI